MGKHSISRRETEVSMGDSIGKQLEQTVSVDDNSLPSPQELQLYQQIDPNIIPFLIKTSIKEQEHRHNMQNELVGDVLCVSVSHTLYGGSSFRSLSRQAMVCRYIRRNSHLVRYLYIRSRRERYLIKGIEINNTKADPTVCRFLFSSRSGREDYDVKM